LKSASSVGEYSLWQLQGDYDVTTLSSGEGKSGATYLDQTVHLSVLSLNHIEISTSDFIELRKVGPHVLQYILS